MKDISNQVTNQRIDWNIITKKVGNLQQECHLELTKKYLIKDLENYITVYQNKYDATYDPVNPPIER